MNKVYITSSGTFLPNDPISNDEMEDYLGIIHGIKSKTRTRILNERKGFRFIIKSFEGLVLLPGN